MRVLFEPFEPRSSASEIIRLRPMALGSRIPDIGFDDRARSGNRCPDTHSGPTVGVTFGCSLPEMALVAIAEVTGKTTAQP